MQEQTLRRRLMIIISCIFILPSFVLCYIFFEQNLTLTLTHFVLVFFIVTLAVIGIILVRYVFEAVSTTADFLKRATEGGEKLSLDLHQEAVELNEISTSLTRMMERFEKTTESLNQAKEALHESEEKYRNILESIEEGYYELDHTGSFTFFNEACRRIYGYSRNELASMNALKMADEDNAKRAFKYFNEVYTTGKSLTWIDGVIIRKDGLKRNVEASVSLRRDTQGQPIGFRGIIRDVTERKQAEELYKTLAEKSMAGVYVLQDGKFCFVNSNAASYAGYTREELLGQKANILVNPEDTEKVRQNSKAMLKGELGSPYEFRIITKKGETRWIMETVTSILYGGRPAILGNSMDVTDHKKMEEEIRNLSVTDPLTGLYNRRGFLALAEQQLKIAKRTKTGLLLLFTDLNGMKWINDNLGHKKGDEALIEAAGVLKKAFRESDIVARIGGDEFSVLALGAKMEDSKIVQDHLQHQIDLNNSRENREYALSMSIGIAYNDPERPSTIDELMAQADALMYEQKKGKRSKETLPIENSLQTVIVSSIKN